MRRPLLGFRRIKQSCRGSEGGPGGTVLRLGAERLNSGQSSVAQLNGITGSFTSCPSPEHSPADSVMSEESEKFNTEPQLSASEAATWLNPLNLNRSLATRTSRLIPPSVPVTL